MSEALHKKKRPKVGLVLGGGGIKPFSSIPLFDFLRQAGIPLDVIAGTSGGALVGALRAIEFTSAEMQEVVAETLGSNYLTQPNYSTLAALMGVPFFQINETEGIVNPDKYKSKLRDKFGDRKLEDLPLCFIAKATDVHTGESISLKDGLLRDCVYASTAIYPFMPPIFIKGRYLIDGTFSTPLGLSDLIDERVDLIILVTFSFIPDYHPTNFLNYFNNLFCLSMESKGRQALAMPMSMFSGDVVCLEMCLDKPATIFDTKQLGNIIAIGERTMQAKGKEILDIYNRLSMKLNPAP
jgi:NTE family protein